MRLVTGVSTLALRLFAVLALLVLTQLTRFENHLSIRYDGSRLEAESEGIVVAADVRLGRIEGVDGTFQRSMSGVSGATAVVARDEGGRILSSRRRTVLYLLGQDFLGNLEHGAAPSFRPSFGDWTVDRIVAQSVSLLPEALPETFTLDVSLVGRGEKTISLIGTKTVAVTVHDGFIDNALSICVEGACPASMPGAAPISVNLARIANFFLEPLLFAVLLSIPLGSLREASSPAVSTLPPRTAASLVGVLAVTHFAFAVWLGAILGFIPHIPDSAVYYRQAILLTRGLFYVPDFQLEPAEAFLSNGSVLQGKDIFYCYNHFWPSVLAPAVIAGIPHLVNPLLSTTALILLYACGARLIGRDAAVSGAFCYALSPFAILLAGDYMNHTATLACLLGALYALMRASETGRLRWGFAAGSFWGFAFAMRSLTGIALGAPLAAVALHDLVRRRLSLRNAFAAAAGIGVVLTVFLLDNRVMTGSLFRPAYIHYYGIRPAFTNLTVGLDYMDSTLGYLPPLLFAVPWPALFLAIPAFALLQSWRRASLFAAFVAVVAAYSLVDVHGLHGYGSRFLFEGSAAIFFLAGCAVIDIWRSARAPLRIALASSAAALVGFSLWALVERLPEYEHYNEIRSDLFASIRKLDLARSVVVTTDPPWQGLDVAATLFDPSFETAVFIRELPGNAHCRALAQFPDRAVYRAMGSSVREISKQARAACSAGDYRRSARSAMFR